MDLRVSQMPEEDEACGLKGYLGDLPVLVSIECIEQTLEPLARGLGEQQADIQMLVRNRAPLQWKLFGRDRTNLE